MATNRYLSDEMRVLLHYYSGQYASQAMAWEEESLEPPTKHNLVQFLKERGAYAGEIWRWGYPVSQVVMAAQVGDEDHGEYGLGGDWWKQGVE